MHAACVRALVHCCAERKHSASRHHRPACIQIALAHDEAKGKIFREPVVILADKDKEQMDRLVRGVGMQARVRQAV